MPETRKFAQGLKRKDVSSTKRESLQPIRNSVYSDVFVVCSIEIAIKRSCHYGLVFLGLLLNIQISFFV